MIRQPKYIKPGDTIGITAPSFGCATEPYSYMYDISLRKLRERGYNIIEGKTNRMSDGLGISTDPEVAAAELVEFYKRDDIDAIISCGGGELMCETIGHVDFEALRNAAPKWFIGYSDNTNFIFPLVTISGTQGIYGPCISGFAKIWEDPETDSIALLEGTKKIFYGYDGFENPTAPKEEITDYSRVNFETLYEYTDKKVLRLYSCKDGKAFQESSDTDFSMKGVLLGGCIDVLANLVGTRFDRVEEFNERHKDVIWILENCELSPMSYRRALWNLREAGWFNSAAGFVIGRPCAYFGQEMMGVDMYNAVTDILKSLGKPIIMDADIGHVDPMMPVVMGAEATVSVKGGNMIVSY